MRKLYALLLAVALVLSITGTALAAETKAPLSGSVTEQDGGLVLTLRAVEDTVSGTVTVSYDPEVLTFEEVKVAGTLASLSESEGSVTVGYAVSTGDTFTNNEVIANFFFTGTGETLIDIRVDNFNNESDPNLYLPVVTVPEGGTRFKDVARDAWYYDAVEYSAQRGWVNGMGNGYFQPNGDLTRAMFVTMLGRMEGIQAGDYPASEFADVNESAYYAVYVAWAAEHGITEGMNATEFQPHSRVTREQAATFLYRYAEYKGLDVTAADETMKTFADSAMVSAWAMDAMAWATDCGLIIGSNNNLAPRATTTRAQGVTLLQRLDLLLD